MKRIPTLHEVAPRWRTIPSCLALLLCLVFPAQLNAGPSIDAMLVMPMHERSKMADEFFEEQKYRRARKQYGILARLGSKHAQHRLAIISIQGLGRRTDPVQGWVWAALAAEFNDPEYAALRDRSWQELSLDQREEAVESLREHMPHYTDSAVAFQIMTKTRRKMRMDTIGYGLLPGGQVKSWRALGMRGNPKNPGAWTTMLRNLHQGSRMHYLNERVSLGEFEVLEESVETTRQSEIPPNSGSEEKQP